MIRGLYELAADPIDVVCPRCGRRAVSAARPTPSRWVASWPRRLTCGRCGHAAAWEPPGATSVWGAPVDPFFQVPLWLRAECCGGHTLWALHRRHLDLLDDYVGAKLRTDGPGMTLTARLPAWLKSAKHRAEILRVIDRLRHTLDD
ncbi:hypothetical protein ACFPIJ_43890 [Dactylosporangium cerinum]|uniref:TFIIB-type zinc ribbon-containing protein n=1 Tax=Dactylosporangium cerinum TaxID=1434730 RepID=A0ABV9WBC8_9ACTN